MTAIDTYNFTQKYVLLAVDYSHCSMNNNRDNKEIALIGFEYHQGQGVCVCFFLKSVDCKKNLGAL